LKISKKIQPCGGRLSYVCLSAAITSGWFEVAVNSKGRRCALKIHHGKWGFWPAHHQFNECHRWDSAHPNLRCLQRLSLHL